jgi:hypothetical protein
MRAYIPVAKGLELFNRDGLFEIDVVYEEGAPLDEVVEGIRRVLIARHGSEDFTITTQQEMLDVLGSVLDVITFAVGALGGISMLVGGVGIFTIMTISVRERTAEIGLLQAVGAHRRQIRNIFLGESMILAAIGGLAGIALGFVIIGLLGVIVPDLPVSPSWPYVLASVLVATLIGLIAGVLPAWRPRSSIRSSPCARNSRDGGSVPANDLHLNAALRPEYPRADSAHDADDQGAPESRPETRDMKPGQQPRRQRQHGRIEDEHEKTERDDREGQGEYHQQRSYEAIDDPEHDGGRQQPRAAVKTDAVEPGFGQPQASGGDQGAKQEIIHAMLQSVMRPAAQRG